MLIDCRFFHVTWSRYCTLPVKCILEILMYDCSFQTDSLTALAEEARSLKDEVDILRQNEEKVKKYESTIESYKRKLEDMTDLRRTVCVYLLSLSAAVSNDVIRSLVFLSLLVAISSHLLMIDFYIS